MAPTVLHRVPLQEPIYFGVASSLDAVNTLRPSGNVTRPADAWFDAQVSAVAQPFAGRRRRPFVPRARRVAGLLQAHAEVDHVHQDLHVPLRLHVAAHHAETQERRAILGDERGDDRVERALARRIAVGATGGQ